MKEEKYNLAKNIKSFRFFLIAFIGFCLISSINSIRVSAKTSYEEADKYVLTLYEKNGVNENIYGNEIALSYKSDNEVYYDENLLKEAINKLPILNSNNMLKSESPKLIYENSKYTIVKEVYGNSVDMNMLYEKISEAIKSKNEKIDLEELNFYEKPKFTSRSRVVNNAKKILNKYVASKIIYNYAGLTQVLEGNQIKDWLKVDDNFQVILDEYKVMEYVNNLANSYTSSLGSTIPVDGGYNGNNHSWTVNVTEEAKALIENIKSGETVNKYPIYIQSAAGEYFNQVGNTFVEIDMTKQHLWYYKDGYLVVEGDVVTGNVSNGASTPDGVYKIYSKQKDTVLRGDDYAAPVSFWMPFNRNIGLHDANWRTEFGGEIYLNDGSHGCVNAPYYVAKTVYENINKGTYVICHY